MHRDSNEMEKGTEIMHKAPERSGKAKTRVDTRQPGEATIRSDRQRSEAKRSEAKRNEAKQIRKECTEAKRSDKLQDAG